MTRSKPLHSFRVVFSLLLIGTLSDVVTTALSVQRVGTRYEQNPAGILLLGHLDWTGTAILSLLLAWLCYRSCCTVIERRRRLGRVVTGLVAVVAFMRWTAFLTALLWLEGR